MLKSNINLNPEDRIFQIAMQLVESNLVELSDEFNIFDLTDLMIKNQLEREEKDIYTDSLIDYSDEIVSIEDMGVLETIDIAVSGDNLFYCNGILTKNSFGVPAIADFFGAIINTDELVALKQLMIKQLKNRYRDFHENEKFLLGVDTKKMKVFSLENSSVTPQVQVKKKGKVETANDTFDPPVIKQGSSFSDFNF